MHADDTGPGSPILGEGMEVSLLPIHGGRMLRGTVSWVSIDSKGEPVAARVSGVPGLGTMLHGTRVWMTNRPVDGGLLVVFEGVALLPGVLRGDVDLVDLSLLADEPRRAALRTATQRPALLVHPGRASRGTTTLDLSSSGCRVQVPFDQPLAAGQSLQVVVEVDHGRAVWADSQVVWVDDDTHIAALRFTRLDPADQERLDRRVLTSLSSERYTR